MATASSERRDPGALSIRQWLQELTIGQFVSVIVTLAGLVALSFQAGRLWEAQEHREAAAEHKRQLSDANALTSQAAARAAAAEAENSANQRKLSDTLATLAQARKELEQLRKRATDSQTAGQSTGRGETSSSGRTETSQAGSSANPNLRRSAPSQPRTWQEYEGFEYLVGTWRGKVVAGPSIEMTVEFPPGDDVFASIALVGTTCTLSAKVIRATQMFSASQFYFKPTTISAGCPDVDYVKVVPVLDSMQWELNVQNGRPLMAALARKI